MALGRRKSERQGELWIAAQDVPRSAGHPFYQKLNRLLAEAEFDEYVESLCGSFYAAHLGRPGIPPGVYFRMLLDRLLRGDRLATRDRVAMCGFPVAQVVSGIQLGRIDTGAFLADGDPQAIAAGDSRAGVRVGLEDRPGEEADLKGKAVAVDATLLEANAAMKSIVRRDTGEDWKEYLRRLMAAGGGYRRPYG